MAVLDPGRDQGRHRRRHGHRGNGGHGGIPRRSGAHPGRAVRRPAPGCAGRGGAPRPTRKAISQEIAEQGAVLLKNDGVLPLSAAGTTIAVIGQTASNTPTGGSQRGLRLRLPPPHRCPCTPQAPLDSITAWASANGGSVVYNDGADPAAAAAVAAARTWPSSSATTGRVSSATARSLSLDGNGNALIDAVATANPNTVVVLQTGGPVLMPWLGKVKGVLEVWYAGEQMGPAVTNLLSGAVNPQRQADAHLPGQRGRPADGRLPGAVPGHLHRDRHDDTAGAAEQRHPPGGVHRGPQDRIPVVRRPGHRAAVPFGHGLSYTTFEYSQLRYADDHRPQGGSGIRFRIKNTGTVAGTEDAQAYVELPASTGEPSKRLVGWRDGDPQPGQTQDVEITLSRDGTRGLAPARVLGADRGQMDAPPAATTR